MMIFRLSCPQEVRQIVSSTAVRRQSWPIFIVYLKARDLIEKRRGLSFRGARATSNPYPRPTFPDKRPISRSKNLAETTSTATLELGTNLSRKTGDVLVIPSVGADPRIALVHPAAF